MGVFLITSLISLIIMVLTIFMFKRKAYEDKNFNTKIVLPVWLYVIIILISLIPFIGLIMNIVVIVFLITSFLQKGIYYKAGWFVKLLLKEL